MPRRVVPSVPLATLAASTLLLVGCGGERGSAAPAATGADAAVAGTFSPAAPPPLDVCARYPADVAHAAVPDAAPRALALGAPFAGACRWRGKGRSLDVAVATPESLAAAGAGSAPEWLARALREGWPEAVPLAGLGEAAWLTEAPDRHTLHVLVGGRALQVAAAGLGREAALEAARAALAVAEG